MNVHLILWGHRWGSFLGYHGTSGLVHDDRLVSRTRANYWSTLGLSHTVHQLLALGIAGSTTIDNNVLGVARSATEEIHDDDAVAGVSLYERVSGHPNLPYLRETGESCHFRRVHEVVIAEIQALQGKETFDTSE
jgi:hypothetical protein